MVFSSLTFLFLFFPLVMGVYYLCPRALRNLWLLLTSLLFYAWGEPVYIRLMAASILFNYLCGLGVAALQKREKSAWPRGCSSSALREISGRWGSLSTLIC